MTGRDGALWHNAFRRGGWSAWQSLGAPSGLALAGSGPAAASAGQRLDAFALGQDRALWHIAHRRRWSRWQSLGGAGLRASPAAVAWSRDRLDVTIVGSDSLVWQSWWQR